MIGLAFSHLASAENIGYIIPCEEIDLFLEDIADGHYDGKPALFDEFQPLENPALRAFLKVDKAVQGIIVRQPSSADPGYPLQAWDLITHIGETPIDDEGMVKIEGNLRVLFTYMVQRIAKDGKVPLTLWRAGKELHLQTPVQAKEPQVIPDLTGAYPSYFVYGPLVFSTASVAFVTTGNPASAASRRWMTALTAVGSPLIRRLGDKPAFDGEGLVVVSSPFFPHKLSKGYGSPMGEVVKSVNGIAIKNLDHLVAVLRDSRDEFIRLEFSEHHSEALVFPRAQMVAATDDILADNGLRSQGSPDTLAVWNAGKSAK
jgi:S1-C subfamily serine protease